MKKLILLGIVLIMLPTVLGLGVSPGNYEMFFTPNKEDSIEMKIYRSADESRIIHLDISGELSQYIEFEETRIEFEETETMKTVLAKIYLPETIPPGPNTANISIRLVPKETSMVGAVISVISQITVISPYPNKFIRSSFAQSNFIPNQPSDIIIETLNLGSNKIDEAELFLEIRDRGKTLHGLRSKSTAIESFETVFFTLPWNTDISPGTYTFWAEILYDDESKTISRNIPVGEQVLKVAGLKAALLQNSQTNLEIYLFNDWNRGINEAWVEVELTNKVSTLGSARSVIARFAEHERKSLTTYLTLGELIDGEYQLHINIHYDGKISKETFKLIAEHGKLKIANAPIRVTPASSLTYMTLLMLLVIAGLLFVYYSYKKKT